MVDTPEGMVSGSAAAGTDTGQSGSSDPDIDLEELRAASTQAGIDAATAASITDLRRATGHIPGMQKALNDVQAKVARIDSLEASNKQLADTLNALISAIPEGMIPARALDGLRVQRNDSNADILSKIQGLEDRITGGQQQEQPGLTPEQAQFRAAWDTATNSVLAYAERQGYTGQIPNSVWQDAMRANPADPAAAALQVARYIDQQKASGSQQERRAERQDASRGATSSRAGGSGGGAPLTLDAMRKMSVTELMRYPAEERERALASQG